MSLPASTELDLVPTATYLHCDLSPHLTQLITRIARTAYLHHQKAELLYWKDVAERIKKEVESAANNSSELSTAGSAG